MGLFTILSSLFITALIVTMIAYFIYYMKYIKQKNPIKTGEVYGNKQGEKAMVFQVNYEKGRVHFTYIVGGRPFGYVWNVPIDIFEERFNLKLKQDGEE